MNEQPYEVGWKRWISYQLLELTGDPAGKAVPQDLRDFATLFLDAAAEHLKLRGQVDVDPRQRAIAQLRLVKIEEDLRDIYIDYRYLTLAEALQVYKEQQMLYLAANAFGVETGQNIAYMIEGKSPPPAEEWRKYLEP